MFEESGGKRPKGSPAKAVAVLAARAVAALREVEARRYEPAPSPRKSRALAYATIIDNLSHGVCFFDRELRLILSNRRWAEMYRLTPAQVRPGTTLREIVQSRVAAGTCAMEVERYLALCTRVDAGADARSWTVALEDGRAIRVCNRRLPDGGWVATHEEITGRAAADAMAMLFTPAPGSRERAMQILEMIALGAPLKELLDHAVHLAESRVAETLGAILLLDEDGARLRQAAAPNLARAHGAAFDGVALGPRAASHGAAVARRATVIVADTMNDPLWRERHDLAAEQCLHSCWSIPILSRQGAPLGVLALYSRSARRPTELEARHLEEVARIAGLAIERQRIDDRMHYLASHDPLTRLPNRTLLNDRLEQAILHARRYDRGVAVAYIDLDGFKSVNDHLGHHVGDQLLQTVSDRIVDCVRATDTVARIGGDEFVVVLFDQPRTPAVVSATVEKIRTAISRPIRIGLRDLAVTSSIGVANYPDDGTDAAALLAKADTAMYRAKAGDRVRLRAHRPSAGMKRSAAGRSALRDKIDDLRKRSREAGHSESHGSGRVDEISSREMPPTG